MKKSKNQNVRSVELRNAQTGAKVAPAIARANFSDYLKKYPHLVSLVKYASMSAAGLLTLTWILPESVVSSMTQLGLTGVRAVVNAHLGQAAFTSLLSGGALIFSLFGLNKSPSAKDLLAKTVHANPHWLFSAVAKAPIELSVKNELQNDLTRLISFLHEKMNPDTALSAHLVSSLNQLYGVKAKASLWIEVLSENENANSNNVRFGDSRERNLGG